MTAAGVAGIAGMFLTKSLLRISFPGSVETIPSIPAIPWRKTELTYE